MVNKSFSVEIDRLNSYDNDVDELRELLKSVPTGATYSIHVTKGDRPWESDSFSIKFSWKS